MLDYKDVTFSFLERKRRVRRRRLALFLLLALAVAVFLGIRWWQARAAVSAVQDLLLADRPDQAEQRLRQGESTLFQRANFRELRALLALWRGRGQEASARFAELGRSGASTTLRSGLFLALFFDRGETAKLKAYSDYLLPRGGDEVRWHHALCRAACLDPAGAEAAVSGLTPAFRRANAKALALLAGFTRRLRSGRVDYIFDRNEVPLAYFDLGQKATRPLVPGIGFAEFDAQFREGARRFRLTLDGGLQRRIDSLFRNHFGTLVLLDLPESSIAAAYSKPRRNGDGDAAFYGQFQPASVIKIVTLLAYLRRGADTVFPLACRGSIELGGRSFYDLAPHGLVRDPARALALSCNVAFARMGQAVGPGAMADLLRRFLFDAPPFPDLGCRFPTGRLAAGALAGTGLVDLAVGRGRITLTTLHAAVLAAIFAGSGRHFPPYLVDDVKNILGLGFYRHEGRLRQALADDLNFLRVQKAMAAVVEDEDGTAHRAAGTVRLAVKTGTAGSSAAGLDSLFIGFVPVDKPRYAFAYRLEGGGQAGAAGALFLKDLLRVLFPGGE